MKLRLPNPRLNLGMPRCKSRLVFATLGLLWSSHCLAHLIGDPAQDGRAEYSPKVNPPTNIVFVSSGGQPRNATNRAVAIAAAFQAFAPKVRTHWDDEFFFVESDGMPAHQMMAGITAWQQQVPLPQKYFEANAWRFPLNPVVAVEPQTIRNHFLRGAIAIAVNGVPIFNPQNNRGEISAEIGELDRFGGHAGRADDYHYHAAPLHLQQYVGSNNPIAFALDGYAIYGLTEPDGSAPVGLDALDGHSTPQLGYHYHASNHYPYVNGGFHGQVTEREGQVDPQPRAQPVRPATTPLRGAVITDFQTEADGESYTLTYTINRQLVKVHYGADAGAVRFDFTDAAGNTTTTTYPTHFRPERGDNPPPPNELNEQRPLRDPNRQPADFLREPPRRRDQPSTVAPVMLNPKRSGLFVLKSLVATNNGTLPVEFTGDGAGSSPPLEWDGAPAGTRCYAVIMDHFPGPNDVKWYWTLYNIPADIHGLPKNARGIGIAGNNSVNRKLGYAPPHSKGPGEKTYFITIYALSAPVEVSLPPAAVNRNVLLTAMKDLVLDSAQLKFTYDRTRFIQQNGGDRPPRRDDRNRQNP